MVDLSSDWYFTHHGAILRIIFAFSLSLPIPDTAITSLNRPWLSLYHTLLGTTLIIVFAL